MVKMCGALSAAAAVLAIGSSAVAQSVSLAAARDNTLYQDPSGAVSNGAGQHMFAGANSGLNARRGLLAFDLSAVPADATITGVTLTLHMSRASGGASSVALHRLLADWGEGTTAAGGAEGSGGPATPGSATWLHRFHNDTFWATPGGDFDAAVSAAAIIDAEGFYQWSSPGLIADVQAWVNGASGNFGWLLLGDEASASSAKRFDSRDNTNAALRPRLVVEYVPAPGAGVALVFGAAAAGRRRRR